MFGARFRAQFLQFDRIESGHLAAKKMIIGPALRRDFRTLTAITEILSVYHMRSLPPPRLTRKRRWRRAKRAVANVFRKGFFSHRLPARIANSPQIRNDISFIKRSRILMRPRKRNFTDGMTLRDGAQWGYRTLYTVKRLTRHVSRPMVSQLMKKPKVRVSVRV